MAAILRAKLPGQDESTEVQLRHGSNVVGKQGGPADVHLASASLSRRHAMITVGERAEDCSVEDLNSTNKSAILNETGELTILEPGTFYRLAQRSELVFGDVQAVFEFVGGDSLNGSSEEAEVEVIQTPGASTAKMSLSEKTRPMSGSTGVTQTTAMTGPLRNKVDKGAPIGAHQEVYAHAKNDLGMTLPYESDMLWIAEASLQMPLPEGWVSKAGPGGEELFSNEELDIETETRPQTVICRNLYQETKRKAAMEDALGTALDEESLPRLLLLHPSIGVNLFHYILPGRNVLGKAVGSVDIILESTACSKRHAYIEMRSNRFFLADLSSTNGTYIGQFPDTASQQVGPGVEVEVTDGQLILFGEVECTLSAPEGEDIVRQAVTAGSQSQAAPSEGRPKLASLDHPLTHDAPEKPEPSAQPSQADSGPSSAPAPAAVDYNEIRKIIREEVAAAQGVGDGGREEDKGRGKAGREPRAAGQGVVFEDEAGREDTGGPKRMSEPGGQAAQGGGLSVQDLDGARGPGESHSVGGSRGAKEAVIRGQIPVQSQYDVQEEVRLAEELASLEAQVAERVDEVREVLGVEKREDPNPIPSRRKGFLARQEARRKKILETAANYYRKQSPLSEFGPHLLPTGSLHRILAFLDPIPHLCIAAVVCRGLRDAASCTLPWTTVNGDEYQGLWNRLVLSGTGCADGHTLIGGIGPERLGHVVTMDLSGIKTITDDTLAVVAEQCPLLQELSLKRRVDIGPAVTDVGLQDIASCCGQLRVVHLTWCSKLTDEGISALADYCPKLQLLDVAFCHLITDKGVLQVMSKCPLLEELVLEGCERISEQGIVALAQSSPSVKKLSLAGCMQGCTTLSVIQVARSMSLLTHLDLTGLPGLQDAAVWQKLSLAWCVQLTDHSFMQVGKNCPLLVELNLRGCKKVSDSAVVQIAHNCCYLTLLDLRGCEQVSQSGLDAMALMIPSCLVLFLDNTNSSQRK